jgi:hypothetical protein
MYANAKMIPVEPILGMGEGWNKGEWRSIKYDIFDTF